jgi:hypothetical protein
MASIKGLVFGLIVFLLVVGCGIAMLAEANIQTYISNPQELGYYNQSFNKITSLSNNITAMNSQLKNSGSEGGDISSLNILILTGWQRLKQIDMTIGAVTEVVNGSGEAFGVPPFVLALISIAITCLIIFAILAAIFMRDI